jgi:hypothetical protein
VLITLVLDNDLEGEVDQIDSTDRTIVVADDDIALRCRQAGQNQAQSQPRLARRVNTLSD